MRIWHIVPVFIAYLALKSIANQAVNQLVGLNRQSHQIIPLRTHNAGFGELAYFQGLLILFGNIART